MSLRIGEMQLFVLRAAIVASHAPGVKTRPWTLGAIGGASSTSLLGLSKIAGCQIACFQMPVLPRCMTRFVREIKGETLTSICRW